LPKVNVGSASVGAVTDPLPLILQCDSSPRVQEARALQQHPLAPTQGKPG